MPMVVEYVKGLVESPDTPKCIIFSRHRDMTDALAEVIPEDRRIIIDGRVPKAKRGPLVDQFQEEKSPYQFCLAGLQAASEGLNMTAATLVVTTELDFTPTTHIQAEARAYRNGQTRKVTSVYLLLKHSTDDCLWDMIDRKLSVLTKVLDGTSGASMLPKKRCRDQE